MIIGYVPLLVNQFSWKVFPWFLLALMLRSRESGALSDICLRMVGIIMRVRVCCAIRLKSDAMVGLFVVLSSG